MKKRMSVIAVYLLLTAGLSQAEESKKLGVTLDISYHSKWLSKGVEAYGQQGALFKTIDLDFYGTGFGVKVTHRNATSSGYVDNQRFDYRPYYKGSIFENKSYATNFDISVGYEHYPGLSRNTANTTWEWIYALSWPNLLPQGFVPSYIVHYEYPASSGNPNRRVAGWVHRFKLAYDLNIPQVPLPIQLSSEIAYNDGLGGRIHDWAYANFGVSSKVKICENMMFIPGVYQQVTLDDSTSKRKDITYCILSMRYKF